MFGGLSRIYRGEALINDKNTDLVNLLKSVQEDDGFINKVEKTIIEALSIPAEDVEARREFFFNKRAEFNEDRSRSELFYFLHSASFGSKYAVSNGKYSATCGLYVSGINHAKKTSVRAQVDLDQFFDRSLIEQWRDRLENTVIENKSYEELEFNPDGAFVFSVIHLTGTQWGITIVVIRLYLGIMSRKSLLNGVGN